MCPLADTKTDYLDLIHKFPLDSSRCLKITEKIAFNIASEASYVYILSGQKFIKNVKKKVNLASF